VGPKSFRVLQTVSICLELINVIKLTRTAVAVDRLTSSVTPGLLSNIDN
jgi:hypothetical protein